MLTTHRTDPNPSTTHKHDCNRSTSASIPPHTSSAKSSKWGSQSHKRRKALSTTRMGWTCKLPLESLLNSGNGAGGNEERERQLHLAPPQLCVPSSTRDEPPHQRAPCSAEWLQGAQTQKGGRCAGNTRTLPTTPFPLRRLNSKRTRYYRRLLSWNELSVLVMVGRALSVRRLLRTSNPASAPQPPLRVPWSRTRISAIP